MLPSVRSMYTNRPEGGAEKEGRRFRKGGTTMEPGAFIKQYSVRNIIPIQIQDPRIPHIPMTGYTYQIDLKTFLPMSIFFTKQEESEVNRLETVAFWSLSYNEILIHNAKMQLQMNDAFYKSMKEIAYAWKDDIIDVFNGYLDVIINDGDFSMNQFTKYAKEHERSRAPFGTQKWGDLLESETRLRSAWTETNLWIRDFQKQLPHILKLEKPLIKAENTYAALRARKADYEIREIGNYDLSATARKFRDRKAGGVRGLSQLEYPIFHTEVKKKAYKLFEDFICKLLVKNRDSMRFISTDGIATYDFVKQNDDLIPYDLENAEKQVGNVLDFLPFNVDLSHPMFPSEIAAEMYSGIGPTRPTNEITAALFLKAVEGEGYQVSKMAFGGDNLALNVDLSGLQQPIVTKEERFLGWMMKEKRFGPPSLVTDSPTHARSLPNKTTGFQWLQGYQHILRPTQAVVNYDLLNTGSAVKLIDWCMDNIKEEEVFGASWIGDAIREEEILKLKFMDEFAEEVEFCKMWIPYHENDEQQTDARLILRRN